MSASTRSTARRAIPVTILGVLALSLALALSARIQVPFWPVPMTMQPFAVLAIAGLCGWRMGTAAVLAYLAEGAAGLPVFAHGGGLAYLAGPTAGYLLGMLPAAALVGWGVARAAGRPLAVLAAMLGGMAVLYAVGLAWLATLIGARDAWSAGAAPFLIGDAVKIGLATALVLAAGRARRA